MALFVFEGNQFNGDVAPALAELQSNGTVRIIDLAFVSKDADGGTAFIELEDADVADAFAGLSDGQLDLLSDDDLDFYADTLEPDSSALIIVWENSWAARFAAAVRDSGGYVESMVRIPRQDVLVAIAAINEDEGDDDA